MDRPDHPQRDRCGVELPTLADAEEWVEAAIRALRVPILPLGFDPMDSVATIADEEDRSLKRIALRGLLILH
jgi:hypothetical protein